MTVCCMLSITELACQGSSGLVGAASQWVLAFIVSWFLVYLTQFESVVHVKVAHKIKVNSTFYCKAADLIGILLILILQQRF